MTIAWLLDVLLVGALVCAGASALASAASALRRPCRGVWAAALAGSVVLGVIAPEQKLLQVRTHLILCFRAEPKIEMVKDGGKLVVRPKESLTGKDGWLPVCEKNLPFELTASFLLTSDAPGHPHARLHQNRQASDVVAIHPHARRAPPHLLTLAGPAGSAQTAAAAPTQWPRSRCRPRSRRRFRRPVLSKALP